VNNIQRKLLFHPKYLDNINRWGQFQEVFEDTKGAIRIRISKEDRQHNGQKKQKYKRTSNDRQNIHIKLQIIVRKKL
jgi:hypothetical protein